MKQADTPWISFDQAPPDTSRGPIDIIIGGKRYTDVLYNSLGGGYWYRKEWRKGTLCTRRLIGTVTHWMYPPELPSC